MKYIYKFYILIVLTTVFSSCIRYNNILLLNEKNGNLDTSFVNIQEPYKIQYGDILGVSVASTDQSSINIFTKKVGQTSTERTSSGSGANSSSVDNESNGYVVNDSGYIEMPIIGQINVVDLNKSQIRDSIQKKIDIYFKYAIVNVQLRSFYVTIIGEVSNRTLVVKKDRFNLLEMLAESGGGFNTYSKTKNVKLIRTYKGKTKVYRVDFTDPNLVNSEYYYLRPNDIIYVEPSRSKTIKANAANVSLVISVISLITILSTFLGNNNN